MRPYGLSKVRAVLALQPLRVFRRLRSAPSGVGPRGQPQERLLALAGSGGRS